MKSPLCSTCGAQMKKNRKTKDGAQRFRCKVCGSSFAHRINSDAKALKEFVECFYQEIDKLIRQAVAERLEGARQSSGLFDLCLML